MTSGRVGLALTAAYCGSVGEKRMMNEARLSSAVTSLISSTTAGTCAAAGAAKASANTDRLRKKARITAT